MSPDPTSPEPVSIEPAPLWRRLLRQPLLWAALCSGLALPWYLTENALDLPPFLLTLVGGWLCGLAWSPEPRFIRSVVRAPKKEKPVRLAPAWEFRTAHRLIRFSAIPMSLRTLGWIIAAVVVVVGSVTTITLIATDLIRYISSGTLLIFLSGTVIALPAYFTLTALLKRKTVTCSVEFAPDHVQIDDGTDVIRLGLADLDRFLWRCESDYARLELRGGGHDISLITGIARVPPTVLPELPKLPDEIACRLAAVGLVQQRTRRAGVTVFKRLSVSEQ